MVETAKNTDWDMILNLLFSIISYFKISGMQAFSIESKYHVPAVQTIFGKIQLSAYSFNQTYDALPNYKSKYWVITTNRWQLG